MPYCQTCGKSRFETTDVVWRRDYYWHIKCYVENSFPSDGKIIPDSILTYEPVENLSSPVGVTKKRRVQK